MALERTLSIIKPDAVKQKRDRTVKFIPALRSAGLTIIAAKMKQLSRAEAEGFYAVHRERPFFKALVDFMISGPVMIQALQGEGAVLKHRDLMGATDPKKAEPGTIRADFAESIDANAVHGSDAVETAQVEIAYFFAGTEFSPRDFVPMQMIEHPFQHLLAESGTGLDSAPSPRGDAATRGPSVTRTSPAESSTQKVNLLDYDRQGLRDLFAQLGEKPYRAEQVMKWMYHRHVTDFAAMTDVGKKLRDKLEAVAEIVPPKILFEKQAADATHKWLLGMDGGNAIEAVFIPEATRGTLCVSSQVGCGLNCTFCSTGTQGFNRANLSAAEIIGQVFVAAKASGQCASSAAQAEQRP